MTLAFSAKQSCALYSVNCCLENIFSRLILSVVFAYRPEHLVRPTIITLGVGQKADKPVLSFKANMDSYYLCLVVSNLIARADTLEADIKKLRGLKG